ncbi:MAG TPA: MTAP family purine nucleoside phosphorylase [Tepidisphaeraceae bacterium]|jgi:5'-methylthioadenosine phosphorylase
MNELCIGLIGGTGLGDALGAESGQRHEVETPFGRPSDVIVETQWAGVRVLILSRHGAGHLLNPSQVNYRANIFALKQLGCTHLIASGAVGSLRDEFKPKDLVVPDQVIDRTYRRAGSFFEKSAVHVEFAEPFDGVMRQVVLEASKGSGEAKAQSQETPEEPSSQPSPGVPGEGVRLEPMRVHDRGCYVCMEGPAFSSRAESLMHRLWGGDLIGMTAMPEAKLAREAEIPYALVALVTDYDCWKLKPGSSEAQDPHVLLKEILGNLKEATANAVSLIRRTVELIANQRDRLMTCQSLKALELAVWSDKKRISSDEVEKLRPLWGKYFEDVTHET